MPQLKIREMPQDERPREKLLARGADALTNAELIAILLRTGRRGMNVVEVARELLDRYKSFAELSRCSVKELSEIKGIGQAKALELVAAFNLGKRFAQEPLSQQKLDSPEMIHELLGGEMRMLRTESLRVVLLDTRYRLMRVESVSTGSMNESIAHPREIFRPAITYSAYAVVVVHNHPSGDASPSQTDHSLTRRLAEAADLLQIKLLDHIIIGAPPPDDSFSPERNTRVEIGNDNVIREYCTIHRGSPEGSATKIGDKNFLMAGAHIGHNCVVANNVIIANNCLLAGDVRVDDGAFLGGGSSFHQHMHVGRLVMVQGSSAFGKDLPPFIIAAERNFVFGLYVVGLRRD